MRNAFPLHLNACLETLAEEKRAASLPLALTLSFSLYLSHTHTHALAHMLPPFYTMYEV